MYRPDVADANSIKPARGAPGPKPDAHYDDNTTVEADHLEAISEELANVVETAGMTLDKDDDTQVARAIPLLGQLAVRAKAVPDMNVVVTSGYVYNENGDSILIPQTIVPIISPPPAASWENQIRLNFDDLSISATVTAGTNAPPGFVVLATISAITDADTEITNNMITQVRPELYNTANHGKVLLDEVVAVNAASVNFNAGFQGDYFDRYRVEFFRVRPATNGASLFSRVYYSGEQSGNDYVVGAAVADKVTITGAQSSAVDSSMTRGHVDVVNRIDGASDAIAIDGDVRYEDTGAGLSQQTTVAEFVGLATPVDGILFKMSAGNIAAGVFRLYGIR